MEYSKALLIGNVYALAKDRKLKIKDLESGCGVSVGYFSRLRQGENNVAPGADFLLALADRLSVSVDALLTFDFSRATGSEAEVLHFLEKLLRETQIRKRDWQEDYGGYLDTVPVSLDGSTPHPLFMAVQDPDGASVVRYHTMFHANLWGLVPVKTYGTSFPGSRTLYLVQVWNTGDDPASPGDWTELELVMTGPGIYDPIPLCHTSHERAGRLDTAMLRLFDAVEDAAVLPVLTPEAREIISEYLDEGEQNSVD